MNPIRTLTAREIDCRVAQIKKDGLQLLLFKDARCDMAILDETFGPMNWMRHHSRENANCIISIWDESKKMWIEKEDTGTESNTEAEKGLASDSFKRACVNWGIGRELYTSPFIWIKPPNCEIKEDHGRYKCFDRFEVKEIGYNEHREINKLVIVNAKTGSVVFERGTGKAVKHVSERPKQTDKEEYSPTGGEADKVLPEAHTGVTEEQKDFIRKNASDNDYMDIMEQYGANLENMTASDAEREIARINKNNAHPTCERCGKIITGLALPDGSMMTASELIGKSKVTYNGIYCYDCMKQLNKKRKAG